jgi:myo-inositol-1(or 4)-monophosphatase
MKNAVIRDTRLVDDLYQQIADHLIASGKRLIKRTGKIQDIGVLKANLTEEDLRIERELVEIITAAQPSHRIYAEEEHDTFDSGEDTWVIDPISGTAAFIAGLPHYSLVATHLHKGQAVFAAIYDPAVDELYIARKGEGAFLNGGLIKVSQGLKKIMLNLAPPHFDKPETTQIWDQLIPLNVYRNTNSFAVNYCWVAAGRFDGIVTLAKDSFTEFAGAFIIEEAGGRFSTFDGQPVTPDARHFLGGNPGAYVTLRSILSTTGTPPRQI